jgi:hypothetical protein
MKKLSLINLYKAEIKKSMLIQIKGGGEIKCICSAGNPNVTVNDTGSTVNESCQCRITIPSSSIQNRPN